MSREILQKALNLISKCNEIGNHEQAFETFTWMLALRVAAQFDLIEKTTAELEDRSYQSLFRERLNPQAWLHPTQGFTGSDLVDFLNKEFFPHFASLHEKSWLAEFVHAIFPSDQIYIRSGYVIREVLDLLFNIDLSGSSSMTQLYQNYRACVQEYALGFAKPLKKFTPAPIVKMMTSLVNPTAADRVYDPAFGTGGFLLEASFYQRRSAGNNPTAIARIFAEGIHGVEKNPTRFRIALLSLLLAGVTNPNVALKNSLEQDVRQLGPEDRFDVVLCNPEFDSDERAELLSHNFPTPSKSIELLFVQKIMRTVAQNGRGAVLLPEGFFFQTNPSYQAVKKELLSRLDVQAIISLPAVGIKTSLLLFRSPGPTRSLWMHNLKVPDGRSVTVKNGFVDSDFERFFQEFRSHATNAQSRLVEASEIAQNGYKLRVADYLATESNHEELLEPEVYLDNIEALLDSAKAHVTELRAELERL